MKEEKGTTKTSRKNSVSKRTARSANYKTSTQSKQVPKDAKLPVEKTSKTKTQKSNNVDKESPVNKIENTKVESNAENKLSEKDNKKTSILKKVNTTPKQNKLKNDNILKKEVELEIKTNKKDNKAVQEKKTSRTKSLLIVLIIIGLFIGGFILLKVTGKENLILPNNTKIKSIQVINYNKETNILDIVIVPDSNQKYCAIADEQLNKSEYIELENNECHTQITLDKYYIYFKDEFNKESNMMEINDYVIDFGLKEKYYIPTGTSIDLTSNLFVYGNPQIETKTDENILGIGEKEVTGKSEGKTTLELISNGVVLKEIEVTVTNLIVSAPKEFNSKKEYLTCEQYTKEEASLLDEILESRIEEAGYGTRAGAVAAARFLTLEFPYRVSYYWENGRLYNTGTHYVDGEGRYYHKGLYLDSSKYETLEKGAKFFGPAMWGCKMVTYENDPPNFIPGRKYPNGLDCSGFVSWALYNGGHDVGDKGAGYVPGYRNLIDVGDYRRLTKTLINSGEIKVGDLFNMPGHIAILVGEDETHYYIAESLNNYGGVVLKTYTKTNVMEYFTAVVLMDEVYESDGNLTNLWY